MKKLLALLLSLTLALTMVSCTGKPATTEDTGGSSGNQEELPVVPGEGAVKTGLSVSAGLSSSKNASAEAEGVAQTDVTIVAVTVNDEGIITACAIDAVQAKMPFDIAGQLIGDINTSILSKNELGTDYGMGKYSGIGKEWNEQASALAAYAVGKTAEEVRGIAVNEESRPVDADLAASVTISIGGLIPAIVTAVENAEHLGAQNGDTLKIVTTGSFSAPDTAEGEASAIQADVNIAAATMNGDTITSCVIDAVQAKVTIDAAGQMLTDVSAPVLSKNQKGEDYGMGKYSGIGREWNEQAAAFAAYVTGKTVTEIQDIAVNEETRPADEDLASSVTIAVGGFQALLGKLG